MRTKNRLESCVLAASLLLALSCGGEDAAGEGGPTAGDGSETLSLESESLSPDVDWEALDLVYSPMYSAYDGDHLFQVPCYVNGVSVEVEDWQAIPSDAVSFDPWTSEDGTQGVLITVQRHEPTVTIAASSGDIGARAELHITNATPDQWEIGQERYKNGAEFDFMEATRLMRMMFSPDDFEVMDGMVTFVGDPEKFGGSPTDLRCDSCHTQGAENFQVQHTPTQAARFSDDELRTIFTKGMKPEGVDFRVLPPFVQSFYQYFHTWQVTEEQVDGLIVYLRSLTPEGQGDILIPGVGFVPPGSGPTRPPGFMMPGQ